MDIVGNKDYNFGLLGTIPEKLGRVRGKFDESIINPTGNWIDAELPIGEQQFSIYFDTLGCTTFGCTNAVEILAKFKYGVDLNISDRYTAKDSGTTDRGNWVYKVADSLGRGFVLEKDYGYPRKQKTPVFTREDYYKELTPELYELAKESKRKYEIFSQFVHKSDFKHYLKVSPIAVTVRAWVDENGDKVYENPGNTQNHLVVLLGYDEEDRPVILDSYPDVTTNHLEFTEPKYYLKTLEKDYNFGTYGAVFNINKKQMTFYQEKGKSAIYQKGADGKYYPWNSGESFTRVNGDFEDNEIIEEDSLEPKGERLGLVI